MNRKLTIICLCAIAALAVIAGVAVAALYSGTGRSEKSELLSKAGYSLLSSVPTDAVMVLLPSDFQAAADFYSDETLLGWAPLASAVPSAFRRFCAGASEMVSSRELQSIRSSEAVVSFHYTGELLPLLVVDDPKSASTASEDGTKLIGLADSLGLFSIWDGSRIAFSTSDILVKSSVRHLSSGASVVDSEGFLGVAKKVSGKNLLFVSLDNFGKIFTAVVQKPYLKYADFFKSLGSWAAFSIDFNSAERLKVSGAVDCARGVQDFMKVFDSYAAASSSLAAALPQKTLYAMSLPTSDMAGYMKAYQSYEDSRIGIAKFISRQKALQEAAGMSPKSWISALDVREAALAAFDVDGNVEEMILLAVGKPDRCCREGVNQFPYKGFTAALLGGMFAIPDESCCTFRNGWLVIGSEAGVGAYASRELAPLSESTALLAHSDAVKAPAFWMWLMVSGNSRTLKNVLQKDYETYIEAASYDSEESLLMTVEPQKGGAAVRFDLSRVSNQTLRAAAEARAPKSRKKTSDEVASSVDVPAGPFDVRNTGTGKTDQLSAEGGRLTLTEEGVELWSVAFPGGLCGRVGNVDFYQNGKIQFLMVSGSSLHLYDRLGRECGGFPVALEKEVLLGPDVYDFNKARRYNIVVLNTDNTIDMYNLQGKKPASWLGMTAPEKITSLPESMNVGGKSYWAVHTASQTLVFGFYGGEPVKVLDGYVPAGEINLN